MVSVTFNNILLGKLAALSAGGFNLCFGLFDVAENLPFYKVCSLILALLSFSHYSVVAVVNKMSKAQSMLSLAK